MPNEVENGGRRSATESVPTMPINMQEVISKNPSKRRTLTVEDHSNGRVSRHDTEEGAVEALKGRKRGGLSDVLRGILFGG